MKAQQQLAEHSTAPKTSPAPPPPPGEQPLKASEGGVNIEKFIARYEAKVGQLTTANIMLEEQLDGMREELNEVRAEIDKIANRVPRPVKTTKPRRTSVR